MSTDNSEKSFTVPIKMTETQNSLENRINAWTEKVSQLPQAASSQSTNQNFNSQQKRRGNLRGRFDQIAEIEDTITIREQTFFKTKIKTSQDMGTTSEATFEEEAITEETSVVNIQITTKLVTTVVTFSNKTTIPIMN